VFHVEIKRGFRHARAFNLGQERLRRTVLDPWVGGRPIELGDREWLPKDCTLRILEGPELEGPELAMGRAWDSAERTAENVTRRLVDEVASRGAPLVATLGASAATEAEAKEMLASLGAEEVSWADLRARILAPDGGRPGAGGPPARYAALLVVGDGPPDSDWLFDAGLARGALGDGAVLVQLDQGSIPESLAGIDVLRLRPGDEASLEALGERLGLRGGP
jgi:hypothetical protein